MYWENGVSMLAYSFLIESSSKLLVTRTGTKARTSSISSLWFPWPICMFFEMRFDLGTLDSGERSLPFGLLVNYWFINVAGRCKNTTKTDDVLWFLYPQHLCWGVYSFRLSVRLLVCTSVTFVEFTTQFFTELHESFSSGVYLTNHSSESIHIWTIGTLKGRLSFHGSWPQRSCPRVGLEVKYV